MNQCNNPNYPPTRKPRPGYPPKGYSQGSVPKVEVIEEGRHHHHYETGYNPSLKQGFVPPPQNCFQPGLPGVLNPPPYKEGYYHHHNRW